MQFTFDSQNPTELRAVEAAVAVLVSESVGPASRAETHRARFKNTEGAWTPWVNLGGGLKTDNVEVERSTPATIPEAMRALGGTVVRRIAAQIDDYDKLGMPPVSADEKEAVAAIDPDDTTHAIPGIDIPGPQDLHLDSASQPWDAELHSSSRAKIADGTWKKKRGVKRDAELDYVTACIEDAAPLPPATSNGDFAPEHLATVAAPTLPTPPVPPAPPATDVVTMNQIWALISGNKATLNDVLAAAHRMGFADLGAVAQTATAEQRAALLKELTV